jgi:hypothetical protein
MQGKPACGFSSISRINPKLRIVTVVPNVQSRHPSIARIANGNKLEAMIYRLSFHFPTFHIRTLAQILAQKEIASNQFLPMI